MVSAGLFLLILIPVLAVFSVLKPNVGTEDRSKENTRRRTIILSAVIGFSVGAYHAFYGPASGTFYMLAFAAFLKYDLVTANGNSRFITMFVSIISQLTYALFRLCSMALCTACSSGICSWQLYRCLSCNFKRRPFCPPDVFRDTGATVYKAGKRFGFLDTNSLIKVLMV